MKKAKNDLLQFVAGFVMLIVGLFIFSQKVIVSSGWFGIGGMMSLGGIRISSGLIMIPFIAGIVWMFATNASFASKVFTVLSVLLIIVSVIMTTNIHLMTITLYEWVIILVLIFGGAGFIAKVLFAGNSRDGDDDGYSGRGKRRGRDRRAETGSGKSINNNDLSVEEELEQIRRNLK